MTRRYAEGTSVGVDRSMGEIRQVLRRYGAEEFTYGERQNTIGVSFIIQGIHVRISVRLPDPQDRRFTETPSRKYERTPEQAWKAYGDEVKRLWRFLVLWIKANLEAVECGITTLEEAFLAHMVMPDNRTVGAHLIPDLHHVLTSGRMPKALPGGTIHDPGG